MMAAEEKDDWITAPAATAEKDDWVTAPPAPAQHWAAPAGGEFGDLDAQSQAPGASALGDIASATAQGAKEGFGTSPIGMSPQTDQALVKAGVFNAPDEYNPLKGINRALIGGGAALGDLAIRSGSALVGAYQHGISQAGESVGLPQLGRDLAALPEAFPTGDFHGGAAMPVAGIKAAAMETEQRLAAAKVSAIGAATDIDGAIAAAGEAAAAPVSAKAAAAIPDVVESPQVRLLRQTESAILRRVGGDESLLTDAEGVRLSNIRAKMDEMQGPKEAGAPAAVDPTAAVDTGSGAPVDPTADSAAAPIPAGWSVDDRFGQTGQAPDAGAAPAGPITASQVQRRDGVGFNEASRRAEAENAAAAPVPQSAGAAASRDMTHPSQIEMPPDEFAANRLQGETERLAAPPRTNDQTIYIPGTKPTLAEVSGDPRTAMDQAYNAQQPEAMGEHTARANKNADAVADYYADTAGSAQELLRMERAKDERAAANINQIFGSPDDIRPPADATPVIEGIDNVLDHPRQQERGAVTSLLTNLRDRFFNNDGTMKTDPYSLYGIRDHIGDLLNGVGNTETSSAARVVERELMQIRDGVDQAIENAVPGFAKFRAEYSRDSGEIAAKKMLQEARLSLLSGTAQHITPAKWFTFMRNVVEGRSDPFDPASHLSEAQMDRLWNITDQLKRSTLIDAGKPRGSWTSMMQEWGGRFARVAAHGIAASTFPVVGNLGVEMGVAGLRKRSVTREMNRVLNPDLGQQPTP
jgi:hypothetical protein